MPESYTYGNFARREEEALHPELWDGLVGCWSPTLGGGGWTLEDLSGEENHGTRYGTGNIWVPGAMEFGTDDYVVTNSVPVGNTFSVVVRLKSTVAAQVAYNRIAETSYLTGWYLGTTADGIALRWYVSNTQILGGSLNQKWQVIIGIYDGTTASLFVDGAFKNSATCSAPSTSLPIYISRYPGGGYFYEGLISEFLYYSRSLALDEISQLAAGASPLTPVPWAPVYVAPAAGGISMPLVMQQMDHFNGGAML